MKLFQRLTILVLTLFLIIGLFPSQSVASGVFKTDLVDGILTKSDRLTFDLWARDDNNKKIEASDIEVLNNGKTVDINWDDKEKTSYTLNLEVGQNIVTIKSQTNSLTYKITREYANDGDVIGHFTFSLDAFTLGLGYIIEPKQVPIIKGRNSAEELNQILRESGFTYRSTGTLKGGFYLATIFKDNLFDRPVIVPDVLKEKLNGTYNESDYSIETGLGEFDINYMSGWMYSVNNVFPNVGFSDKYMLDGDVMRVQFTLAYGQDIGGGEAMGSDGGGDYFVKTNKDALTKKLALIHKDGKSVYLINSTRITAYKNALNIMAKLNASQSEIDAALAQLNAADATTDSDGTVYTEEEIVPPTPQPNPGGESSVSKEDSLAANRVISQIQVLPSVSELKLSDAIDVQLARQAYDNLSSKARVLVTNYTKLEAVEQQIVKLQTEIDIPTPSHNAAQKVVEQITKLPAIITLKDEQAIKQARQAYEALSNEYKLAVVNYSYLLLAEINFSKLKNDEILSNTKVAQTQMLIENLPTNISYRNLKAIEEARASYNALNATEKAAIKNYDKLLKAEADFAALGPEEDSDVKNLMQLIDSLPPNITAANRLTVEKIKTAFDKLTLEQQKQVANKEILFAAIASLEKESTILIDEDTAIVQSTGLVSDVVLNQEMLKKLYDNEAIQKISFEQSDKTTILVQKEALQKADITSLQVELEVVTIGQEKELVVELKNDKNVILPLTLQLPATKWSNGYLIANTDNGIEAVPHFVENGVITAQVISGQAFSYTTAQVNFNDIATLSNAEEIQYLANRYVIQGSNGLFKPSNSITRAQFATMVARAIGAKQKNETKFTDIKGKSYEQYVQALYELGIVNGISETKFNPSAVLTRQHAATIMARVLRYAGVKQPTDFTLTFSDAASINKKYAADVAWLNELGIMSGSKDKFSPNSHLTRAQMAKILKRTLNTAKIM